MHADLKQVVPGARHVLSRKSLYFFVGGRRGTFFPVRPSNSAALHSRCRVKIDRSLSLPYIRRSTALLIIKTSFDGTTRTARARAGPRPRAIEPRCERTFRRVVAVINSPRHVRAIVIVCKFLSLMATRARALVINGKYALLLNVIIILLHNCYLRRTQASSLF